MSTAGRMAIRFHFIDNSMGRKAKHFRKRENNFAVVLRVVAKAELLLEFAPHKRMIQYFLAGHG